MQIKSTSHQFACHVVERELGEKGEDLEVLQYGTTTRGGTTD